ncbi:hypothetical protein [Pseudotamlana carrageenivorans]|uniref:Uncharacterized protein n=1 Tax=Pseudotamlana carrageenivorans TaxID=2069432 RepID=A0A2I7SF30_9FLAO|nr:hypothetical protein [Tamlana carrageenivorans]AUS04513.1 hypothetical protein C1A40_03055 [Tamlana carrageenivorans]
MTKTAPSPKKYTLWSFYDSNNQQHKYILSLCMQFGWSKAHKVTGKQVANLGALDKWLRGVHKIGQSPIKKPLQDMSTTELSKVITALENMVFKKNC